MKQLQSFAFWRYRIGYFEDRALERLEKIRSARIGSVTVSPPIVFSKRARVNYRARPSISPFATR